jgi:hypothetical protein
MPTFTPLHRAPTFLSLLSEAHADRGLAARQHASYFGGYREILGLAYPQLVAV